MSLSMLLLAVAHTLLASLLQPPGLSGAEVLLLLEIGVAEEEITALADRTGGFQPLDVDQYALAEALNPSATFLKKLPRARFDFGAISELASRSEVFQDERLGLGFVYPAGFSVTRAPLEKGGLVLRIGPRSETDPRAFVSPCVFVFLQENTGIVPEAADPVLRQIGRILLGKLRSSGLRPAAGADGEVTLLGLRQKTVAIGATLDGDAGVLEVALAVDAKGRVVGVGYTASAADRVRMAEAFSRLAGSLVLH